MTDIPLFLVLTVGSYLIGSIPIGYLIGCYYGVDVRANGSGTTGATNVARSLGLPFFFVVFALDAGKAYGYLWLIDAWQSLELLTGCCIGLVLGNTRSIFLGFKGGKGVATLVGILWYVAPVLTCLFFIVWIMLLIYTRIVGKASVGALASIFLFLMSMLFIFVLHPVDYMIVAVLMVLTLWCIYLHRQYIPRVL